MVDIALDLTPGSPTFGDLLIVNGDLVLVDGAQAVLQDLLQRLSTYLGEWFLDNTLGIDYYGQILVKNPDQAKIDALIINTILATKGILQLNSYSFTPNFVTRVLNISFSAMSTSGPVDYTGTLL